MNKPIETTDYKGYQINIHPDMDPMDPITEFDQLGKMICWHNRYNLGHKHNSSGPDDFFRELAREADPYVEDKIEYWENGNGWKFLSNIGGTDNAFNEADERIRKLIDKVINKHYIILPLYLYDHSGITISTGPFSCPWDSGQVGYIYISKEKAKKEYNWKCMNKTRIEKIKSYLESEVKTYDDYLTGNVYGYVISNEEDDHIDSCWGFFGDDYKESGLLEMAQNAIDCELSKEFEMEQFINNCFAL